MRTTMKGGVWKNSEDEILKAAVMKYGLNNWSRVASLLVRKSAKQCKSRWYEWLDPSVKKTEWTRDEEEKLLHLAKLFPNQWRTIAPVVGRTAHQCLEHYDRLLDQAQGRTEEDRANDPRRLRPGEIDPHPETKPSRADAVDMEDDEKEMLAEARARLANTRGKKAKRKAREKQLEEARRLAALQKRRELKAAGLGIGKWKKRDDAIDYGTEVPFEQQPPKGFYAVGPEETPASMKGFGNVLLQQLEGQRRIEEEKRLRREDTRKLKRIMEENLPEGMKMIEKINDPQMFRKRTRLTLPEPQLSETELRDILMLGKPALPGGTQHASGDGPTAHLLDTAPQMMPTQLMTPMRTPAREDTVMLAAKDAVARREAQTPLEGGMNPVLHDVSLGTGAMPSRSVPQTPNPLTLSSVRAAVPSTPFSVRSTPRGNVGGTLDDSESSNRHRATGSTEASLRTHVKTALAQLPLPRNDIEIQLPDVSETLEDDDADATSTQQHEEDAEDALKREQQEEERRRELEFQKQTKVIQQNLPRPLFPDQLLFETPSFAETSESELRTAERLLTEEMRLLILNDAVKFPIPVKGVHVPRNIPQLDALDLEDLKEAGAVLHVEAEAARHHSEGLDNDDDDDLDPSELTSETWDKLIEQDTFIFDVSAKHFVPVSEASEELKLKALEAEFTFLRARVAKDAQKARKLEAKLTTIIKGYMHRAATSLNAIESAWNETLTVSADVSAFEELERCEQDALQRRKQYLCDVIGAEQRRHEELQRDELRKKAPALVIGQP